MIKDLTKTNIPGKKLNSCNAFSTTENDWLPASSLYFAFVYDYFTIKLPVKVGGER